MLIPVDHVSDGLHPGEVVVAVRAREGAEKVMVDRRSLDGDRLEVGYPVGQDGDFYLVELPQETFRGYWRVWVPKTDVQPGKSPERAVA